MKRATSLYNIDGVYVLSYIEDGEEKQFTSPDLEEIKAKCNEYAFSLDFTGAVNDSK
jgi:hypothetical protein